MSPSTNLQLPIVNVHIHPGRLKSFAVNSFCPLISPNYSSFPECPDIEKPKPICEGKYWAFYQTGYQMEGRKKCKKIISKSIKPVPCNKVRKLIFRCDRQTCKRTKYMEAWKSEQCQCRLTVKKTSEGKCCKTIFRVWKEG